MGVFAVTDCIQQNMPEIGLNVDLTIFCSWNNNICIVHITNSPYFGIHSPYIVILAFWIGNPLVIPLRGFRGGINTWQEAKYLYRKKQMPFHSKLYNTQPLPYPISGSNYTGSMRGAGDLVYKFAHPLAKVIDSVVGSNLSNCQGCAQRREAWNNAMPFK
jgi:hypothetical protein